MKQPLTRRRLAMPPWAHMTLVAAAMVAASGCADVAPATGEVSIESAVLADIGADNLELTITLANGSDEDVHVYDGVRAVLHDADSEETTLLFRDRPWVNTGSSADCHLFLPSTTQVGARRYATVVTPVAREYVRLTANAAGDVAFEAIPLEDAAAVFVELAWADEPFEATGCSAELADALLQIQDGIALGQVVKTVEP